MATLMSDQRFITIIIPVFNDQDAIAETLRSLEQQTYPADSFETIVVDNGSTDRSLEVIRHFAGVKLLEETNNLGSPYSCRNRGIEASEGDLIVLLDSTCVPQDDWLSKGVAFLEKSGADIVGGNVKFDFRGKANPAKIYDSITNIKMRESIEERGVAKTANLFIKRSVFDRIGLFPEGVRSGADVRWTRKATDAGLTLVFSEEAIVYKWARSYFSLLRKQWRVGLAQPAIWKEEGKLPTLSNALLAAIKPISLRSVSSYVDKRGQPEMKKKIYRIWLFGVCATYLNKWANLIGMIKLRSTNP